MVPLPVVTSAVRAQCTAGGVTVKPAEVGARRRRPQSAVCESRVHGPLPLIWHGQWLPELSQMDRLSCRWSGVRISESPGSAPSAGRSQMRGPCRAIRLAPSIWPSEPAAQVRSVLPAAATRVAAAPAAMDRRARRRASRCGRPADLGPAPMGAPPAAAPEVWGPRSAYRRRRDFDKQTSTESRRWSVFRK